MDEDRFFESVREYKLLAKHEVGQNFLVDPKIASQIVDLADIQKGDKVLEIGCGAGSLSFFIAQKEADCDFIDIDEGLITKLAQEFSSFPNAHFRVGNIMRWDLASYNKIVGNLPYYITSGIIKRVLLEASSCSRAVMMVQKEVIRRLQSHQGDEGYGPLPILLEDRTIFQRQFFVSREAFSPAPHIDSAVFTLDFKKRSSDEAAQLHEFYRFISKLFLHRRKTIFNNLSSLIKDGEKADRMLTSCGISPKKRPEDLSLKDYTALFSQLH